MSVFDASAVLAILLNEKGADKAGDALKGALLSAVNYCEVATRLVDKGIAGEAAREAIATLGLDVRPFDAAQAAAAAALRPATRRFGLSLGDRACLALALITKEPVLTGDRKWAELMIGVNVKLFR